MRKRPIVFVLAIGLTAVALYSSAAGAQVFVAHESNNKTDSKQPEISGTTVGNTGCAVLEKHKPVKGPLLVIGMIYARTQYVVLNTYNCKLEKEKYTGTGDIKALNQTAINDKIKLVVIPSHYTDDELQQAQDICKSPSGAQSSPAAPPTDKSTPQ